MDKLNWKWAGVAAVIGIVFALLLGVLFHVMGANSHGWTVLILLLAACVAFFAYKKFNIPRK